MMDHCNMPPTTRSAAGSTMPILEIATATNTNCNDGGEQKSKRRVSKPQRFEPEVPIPKSNEKRKKKNVGFTGLPVVDTSLDKKKDIRRRYARWEEAPTHVKAVGFSGSGAETDRYEVEKVLEYRCKIDGTEEFFVKWKGWSSIYNNWEPLLNLDGCGKVINDFSANFKANRDRKVENERKASSPMSDSGISSGCGSPLSNWSFLTPIKLEVLPPKRCATPQPKRCASPTPIFPEETKKPCLRYSPVNTKLSAYPSLSNLVSIMKIETFDNITEEMCPTEVYGSPLISGAPGIRVRLTNGALKVVKLEDAFKHWPTWYRSMIGS